MEDQIEEILRLQGCINDLISVLALPALWSGHGSSQIMSTLLDGLVGMLRLKFAYARLNDSISGSPIEFARMAERRKEGAQPHEIGRALDRFLKADPPISPFVVPNFVGAGDVRVASFRLGLQDEIAVLVAGSERADFPTHVEKLLLQVAANQAAIGLQEARRLSEQRRAAEELELKVIERTIQLTALNEELRKEIVERNRAEEILRESEQKFLVIFDKAALAISLARLPDGVIANINEAWTDMYGFTREEAVGNTSLELGINRDPAGRARLFAEIQQRGSMRNMKATFYTKSSAARVICCNIDVVVLSGEKYMLSTMHDITEQKHAEEELRRSEAYLAQGQRISHTGSWAWNVFTGDLYWSDEHYRIFGLDPEKTKATYPETMQWMHPDDRSFVQQTFEKAVREKSDFELDCRIVRPDGTIRNVRSLAHPVFNGSGDLSEYIGTIIDITEHKRDEEALRVAHAELAHVTRVMTMGELTASIAHEVNQPLGAIVLNGNVSMRLLSRAAPDIDGAREAVECMISDAMRASEIIKRIRALLKKNGYEKAHINVNETIQEVIAMAASQLSRNQVLLRTKFEAGLPPVLGDRIQLQQVLLNLILNGNEAMSEVGWQPRELLIKSQKSKRDEILVAVRDSGTGLKTQNAEHIFDAFFTTKESGLGLGLSISRTIIEAHGGRLWATPNKDKGATLQFTLPTGGGTRS